MKTVKLNEITPEESSHSGIMKKVLIHKDKLPHIYTFAQVTLKPGQKTEPHSHKGMYEVFLVEKGNIKIFINNREYIEEEGSCIITEPNDTHKVSNPFNKPSVITYFQLKI